MTPHFAPPQVHSAKKINLPGCCNGPDNFQIRETRHTCLFTHTHTHNKNSSSITSITNTQTIWLRYAPYWRSSISTFSSWISDSCAPPSALSNKTYGSFQREVYDKHEPAPIYQADMISSIILTTEGSPDAPYKWPSYKGDHTVIPRRLKQGLFHPFKASHLAHAHARTNTAPAFVLIVTFSRSMSTHRSLLHLRKLMAITLTMMTVMAIAMTTMWLISITMIVKAVHSPIQWANTFPVLAVAPVRYMESLLAPNQVLPLLRLRVVRRSVPNRLRW